MGKMLLAMAAGALICGQAIAAEWAPIKIEDTTVREIDTTSIVKNGPVITFTARHTFIDRNEYKVKRNSANYLLIYNRANCSFRTLAQLATEAYDEKMVLISKQQIQQPQDLPVTRDSIDEGVLKFVCQSARPAK